MTSSIYICVILLSPLLWAVCMPSSYICMSCQTLVLRGYTVEHPMTTMQVLITKEEICKKLVGDRNRVDVQSWVCISSERNNSPNAVSKYPPKSGTFSPGTCMNKTSCDIHGTNTLKHLDGCEILTTGARAPRSERHISILDRKS